MYSASARSRRTRGAKGASSGTPQLSAETRYHSSRAVSSTMPYGPMLPAATTKRMRTRERVPVRSGTVYAEIPAIATMMMAGEDTSPALTAVSPSTSAPITERASATYLGIRTLASTRISSTASRKNISSPGEREMLRMPPEMMTSSPKGISRSRNSCAATYSAGR